jgi:hypothetical protein
LRPQGDKIRRKNAMKINNVTKTPRVRQKLDYHIDKNSNIKYSSKK